ncbi:DUF3237 family protein [Nocardia sp. NPDC005998]|uniref:DUF3237 family protein n=1 Tax=Nocardia sp. NPDC005998 TaxID=3156894 RepID=UPI0033AEBD2F
MTTTPLPAPKLRLVLHIDAALGTPVDLGQDADGRRHRIVPHVGGTFTGPELMTGIVLPGVSGDWLTINPDGSSIGDIRMGLHSASGANLYLQMRALRHGPPEVLARLAAGADVDPSEYVFRANAQIEATEPDLSWLNLGVFTVVAGRQPDGVSFDVYIVE